MPYASGFGKFRFPILSNDRLPTDLRIARAELKNCLRTGQRLEPFENREGHLPEPPIGCGYVEYPVGEARAATAEFNSTAGQRRLVGLIDPACRLLMLYFTNDHYRPWSWSVLDKA